MEGRDPVSPTTFNQIHLSCILETENSANSASFHFIFMHHGLLFSLISRVTV